MELLLGAVLLFAFALPVVPIVLGRWARSGRNTWSAAVFPWFCACAAPFGALVDLGWQIRKFGGPESGAVTGAGLGTVAVVPLLAFVGLVLGHRVARARDFTVRRGDRRASRTFE